VFADRKHFASKSIMNVYHYSWELNGTPLGCAPILPGNIRQGRQCFSGANALAYYRSVSITTASRFFIAEGPGVSTQVDFQSTSYLSLILFVRDNVFGLSSHFFLSCSPSRPLSSFLISFLLGNLRPGNAN